MSPFESMVYRSWNGWYSLPDGTKTRKEREARERFKLFIEQYQERWGVGNPHWVCSRCGCYVDPTIHSLGSYGVRCAFGGEQS